MESSAMIAAFATIALVQGGHFATWFPVPSGQNGYEEFLQAADIVSHAGYETVWQAQKLNLEKSRDLLAQYGHSLDLVERGLRKLLRAPWDPLDPDDDYVLVTIGFVNLTELMENRIRTLFADGRPGNAADKILVGLEFSDRAGDRDLFEALCGMIDRQAILECLEHTVHKLPLDDAKRIGDRLAALSQRQPKVIGAWKAQLLNTIGSIDEFLNRERDPEESEYRAQLARLTDEQKSSYKERLAAAVAEYQSQLDAMFAKEERFWHDMRYTDADPLVEYAVSNLYPFPCAELAVVDRTRIRLGALYCRVIEFKRDYNRLPSSLSEIGPGGLLSDPASGEEFVYRKDSEQSFFIFSRGNEWTGPIHLRTQWSDVS